MGWDIDEPRRRDGEEQGAELSTGIERELGVWKYTTRRQQQVRIWYDYHTSCPWTLTDSFEDSDSALRIDSHGGVQRRGATFATFQTREHIHTLDDQQTTFSFHGFPSLSFLWRAEAWPTAFAPIQHSTRHDCAVSC